jgi:hypothetical protein
VHALIRFVDADYSGEIDIDEFNKLLLGRGIFGAEATPQVTPSDVTPCFVGGSGAELSMDSLAFTIRAASICSGSVVGLSTPAHSCSA